MCRGQFAFLAKAIIAIHLRFWPQAFPWAAKGGVHELHHANTCPVYSWGYTGHVRKSLVTDIQLDAMTQGIANESGDDRLGVFDTAVEHAINQCV